MESSTRADDACIGMVARLRPSADPAGLCDLRDDHYLIRESIAAVSRAVFPEVDDEPALTRFRRCTGQSGRRAGRTVHAPVLQQPTAGGRRGGGWIRDEVSQGPRGLRGAPQLLGGPPLAGEAMDVLHQPGEASGQARARDRVQRPARKAGSEGDFLAHADTPARDATSNSRPPRRTSWWSSSVWKSGILTSEIEKLAVYAGESKRVERADVARMVGAGRVETVWKALDAATTGQPRSALELLDNLIAAGEAPVMLLAAMSASLLKVHHAGRLRRARLPLEEACRIAGIPPFATAKTGEQHAHLGPGRVDQLPATLLRADLDLKGGSTADPRVVLERLLVGLSQPANGLTPSSAFFFSNTKPCIANCFRLGAAPSVSARKDRFSEVLRAESRTTRLRFKRAGVAYSATSSFWVRSGFVEAALYRLSQRVTP